MAIVYQTFSLYEIKVPLKCFRACCNNWPVHIEACGISICTEQIGLLEDTMIISFTE